MRIIPVDQIIADMVLAKDVTSATGNVLLGKGSVIGPAVARRLKNWGIAAVGVEGDETQDRIEAVPKETSDQVRKRLERKFSGVMDNAFMKQIFAAVYQYRTSGE